MAEASQKKSYEECKKKSCPEECQLNACMYRKHYLEECVYVHLAVGKQLLHDVFRALLLSNKKALHTQGSEKIWEKVVKR